MLEQTDFEMTKINVDKLFSNRFKTLYNGTIGNDEVNINLFKSNRYNVVQNMQIPNIKEVLKVVRLVGFPRIDLTTTKEKIEIWFIPSFINHTCKRNEYKKHSPPLRFS